MKKKMKNNPKRLKAVVFIDGSNIYFAQKKMGKWLDWVKVKHFLERNYCILEYRYYIGLRNNDKKMANFLQKLKKVKFTVITKPVKIVFDDKGNKFEKANFDVEITSDVLESVKKLDAVILFSGDSDFDYLIKILHKKGRRLFVYSSRKTLSWELKLSADKHFLLEDLSHLTKGKEFAKL